MKNNHGMKGYIRDKESQQLYNELCQFSRKGVPIMVGGYQAELDRSFTDMILCESDCTYMRDYSFDSQGNVIGITLERISFGDDRGSHIKTKQNRKKDNDNKKRKKKGKMKDENNE